MYNEQEYVGREEDRYYPPAQPIASVNSDELCDRQLNRVEYLIDGLLKPGLAVLAGSPKVGKSWLVLQMCMCVASGEKLWGLTTKQSDVLYISLEDSLQRLQSRILTAFEEPSEKLHLALSCSPLGEEFENELHDFILSHPQTRLIVIDTLQKIRCGFSQPSYAADYSDLSRIKGLADDLNICILMVHHTRKMSDSDRFNEISGTNGIAGSADTLMVLTKEKRTSDKARLLCTGRDIGDTEYELTKNKLTFCWECETADVAKNSPSQFPEELKCLLYFMKKAVKFSNTNTELVQQIERVTGRRLNILRLKRYMNLYRYELADMGLSFVSVRIKGERGALIVYEPPGSLTVDSP